MKFSSPVEKYYNDNRYQFRNIKSDDNKDVIVKIEPSQIKITEIHKFSRPCMAVDFHKLADLQAISKVIRSIENEFINVKSLLAHGRIYFNKVNKDFNALHFRSLCYNNGHHKILVDTIKIE